MKLVDTIIGLTFAGGIQLLRFDKLMRQKRSMSFGMGRSGTSDF